MPHKIEITELTQVVHNEKNFLTALNQNLLRIQEAIDDTLSRTARIPNQMEDVLDMNGKRIINIGRSEGPRDIVTREEIQGLIDSAAASVEELSRLVEEARISLQEYGRAIIQEASEAKDEAVAAAGEASTSETNAAASASAAATSETNAAASEATASTAATNAATWFNRIYGARKQTQEVIIGTPSGSYTGGTDKIETGIDLTDKTVDLFYNGQLIKADGNWEIDDEDIVFSGLTPTVGSTMVIWINDTARMVDVGDLTEHNQDSNAHPAIRASIDTKIAAHNVAVDAHEDIRGTVTDKVIIRQWS